MVLNNKPFQAPPLDTVFERDFKILSLPPTAHLQTSTPNQLMLTPGHSRAAVIQVLPQPKMWQHTKKSFAQMNVNRNLKNRIGIQVGQVKAIKIKEAVEKGRNGESETAEKKRNINHGFVGILCRDSDPMTNLPRTKLPRGEEPRWTRGGGDQARKQQTCGYLRKATGCWGRWGELLQRMNSRPFSRAPSQLYWRTEREPNCREDLEAGKQELGHGKQRRLKAQYMRDIPESDTVSKSAQSAPGSYF
jgi:hypothetical protein